MTEFASLDWYTDVAGRTVQDIYIQELHRLPDWLGACNWLYWLREEKWTSEQVRAAVRESDEWKALHAPTPPPSQLQRLTVDGAFFRTNDGARFTAIECSDFNLFTTYLMLGPARTEEIINERAEIGFNMLRVWLAYWDRNTGQGIPGIGKLNPADFPGMYDQLAPFCELAARYGMYVEFTAFTGGPIDGHWEKIQAGLANVDTAILELCNENNAHPNDNIDPNHYHPFPGIICSHGSNGSESIPVRPWWNYETFHTNDAYEWWRKGGHNGMELSSGDAEGHITPSHVPIIANENTRPDHDGNVNHHEDAAAACALLIAGSCFHSQSGKQSVNFDARDREFAEAHVRGAKSVNLDFQPGHYRHATELETPDLLRVYQRVLPDGRAETVRIRK